MAAPSVVRKKELSFGPKILNDSEISEERPEHYQGGGSNEENTPQNLNVPANVEIMAIHCLSSRHCTDRIQLSQILSGWLKFQHYRGLQQILESVVEHVLKVIATKIP